MNESRPYGTPEKYQNFSDVLFFYSNLTHSFAIKEN